jgi:hypothetical protein
LLRVLGCVASCCPAASLGPGGFELTHPLFLFSAESGGNIQGGRYGGEQGRRNRG